MRDPNNPCLFCNISKNDFELENELAYASYDSYPVSNILSFTHKAMSSFEVFIFDK